MKYTIEGFSQAEAMKFRRTEIVRKKNQKTGEYEEKEVAVTLDCTDLVILRWFVDFWPRMTKIEVGGRQYAWVSYKDLIEDMPLLGIKKRALALRLMKLADFGILTHHTVKNGGTFSYYGFGPEYMRLADDRHTSSNCNHSQTIDEGVANQLTTHSQTIDVQNNSSTKDSSTKQPKKETNKPETFDSIIDGFTENQGLRDALREFLRYRLASANKSKKAFTNQALKLNLTKLRNLSSDTEEMVEIVNQTIEKGWSGFFELKDQKPQRKASQSAHSEPMIGTIRTDNVTGKTDVYRGNGVWEEYVSSYVPQEEDEDIDF